MAGLAASDILRVWEWGRNRHAVDRALVVLALAEPDARPDAIATLTVGQRDARLLAVRDATFGSRLTAVSTCPACSAELEVAVDSGELRADPPKPDHDPPEAEVDGHRVRLRALDSRDLAEAARAPDLRAARRMLLERAVVSAQRNGEPVATHALPEPVLDAVSGLLAERDPQADVTLELRCPDCAHRWQAPLDVAGFLWAEIAASARRLLHEVHALARAYGWREPDVLALSPQRRQAYLELAGSA